MSIGFFSLSPDSGGFKGGGRKGRNRRMRCGGGRRTGRWSHPSGGVDDGGGAGGGSRKASFVARIPLRRGLCIALVVLTSGILLSGLPVAGDGVLVGEGSPMIVSTWYLVPGTRRMFVFSRTLLCGCVCIDRGLFLKDEDYDQPPIQPFQTQSHDKHCSLYHRIWRLLKMSIHSRSSED